MSMLQVNNLTMRFGGLTAINQLDLRVEEGQIFSVIGPNGAGKTTVFNAITGIYEPTAGEIRIDGRVPARRFSLKVLAACVLIGVLTGVAAVLFAINIDGLWRASIKRHMSDPSRPFEYAAAGRDAWDYVWSELAVEKERFGDWNVVSADGKRILAEAATEEEARQLKAELDTRIAQGDDDAQLTQIAAEQPSRKRTVWFALVLGLSLGSGGPLAVWRRSRRTPEVIAGHGIARTFQNIRLFGSLTVLDNVRVGLDRRRGASFKLAGELLDF